MSLVGLAGELQSEVVALVARHEASADQNPFRVYVAGLSLSSRRPAAQVLGVVAELLVPGLPPEDVPWSRLGYQHLQAVKARLLERYKYTTVNRALTAIKGVLRCAFNLNQMSADDLLRATAVKAARGTRLPKGRAISPHELRLLFDACDRARPGGSRDAALLALLFVGGLRRHEAAGLDLHSFEPSSSTLRVVGKGNKERLVHVLNGARRALDTWLSFRGELPGPLLCPVRKDGTVQLRRLSDQSVFDITSKVARNAGILTITPHDFRRSMISQLLQTVDLATVSRCVGHANTNTTAAYDRRGESTRRLAFEQLHVPFE